jgi:hypothetical protein
LARDGRYNFKHVFAQNLTRIAAVLRRHWFFQKNAIFFAVNWRKTPFFAENWRKTPFFSPKIGENRRDHNIDPNGGAQVQSSFFSTRTLQAGLPDFSRYMIPKPEKM